MGGMASAAGEDVKIGLGLKDDPGPTPRDDMAGRKSSYQRRTAATVERERKRNNPSALYKEDDKPAPRQSTMARAAAPSYGVGGVGSAPDLPDPDAVGETEQALLDANRKGRSSTIATSAKGLLAGEESTRKKRSLMGGLIR